MVSKIGNIMRDDGDGLPCSGSGAYLTLGPGSVVSYFRIPEPSAKMVRKTLIPPVFRLLYGFLYLKNEVNVHSTRNKR